MYERMKVRVENVLELGKVSEEYITDESERRALSKWTDEFTHQDHSTIIKVCFISRGLLFVLKKISVFIVSIFFFFFVFDNVSDTNYFNNFLQFIKVTNYNWSYHFHIN